MESGAWCQTPWYIIFFPLWGLLHEQEVGGTHVDLVLLVADQEVVHHACLIQVPQADHVIHTFGRVGVHGAEGTNVLCSDPVFLK